MKASRHRGHLVALGDKYGTSWGAIYKVPSNPFFTHSFNKYLLNDFHVSGVPVTGLRAGNETKSLPSWIYNSRGVRQAKSHTAQCQVVTNALKQNQPCGRTVLARWGRAGLRIRHCHCAGTWREEGMHERGQECQRHREQHEQRCWGKNEHTLQVQKCTSQPLRRNLS